MNGTAAFSVLQQAYDDRMALVHKQQRPVVGYVGNTVPVELIVAAGCVPVRIAPVQGDPTLSDRFIESMADTDVRLIFQLYCSGALDALDLLIMPRSTESQHKLYLSLREARRAGVTSHGPKLWLYDIPHTQRASSHAYGVTRTRALWQALADIGGTPCDSAALKQAIQASNKSRALLHKMHEQRWQQPVSGLQAHVATGALRFMLLDAGHAALQAWLDAGGPAPVPAGPRLLVRGVPQDHAELHRLVESLGARIVAEDDDWGSRAGTPPISEEIDPLQAVFEHYWRDVPCVRVLPNPDTWFKAAVAKPEVDGVLFYLPRPDDVYGWSYPGDRELVERHGLPSLLIRDDARQPDLLKPALRAFIASLPAR
ncbi:MAG: 2-hydroxyacyl-CoA dehydratase [Rubrivivax sp.]|nr:MAG: 2-hydroxyacyl-CoA dehydratase [Rubrivivax sp.]